MSLDQELTIREWCLQYMGSVLCDYWLNHIIISILLYINASCVSNVCLGSLCWCSFRLVSHTQQMKFAHKSIDCVTWVALHAMYYDIVGEVVNSQLTGTSQTRSFSFLVCLEHYKNCVLKIGRSKNCTGGDGGINMGSGGRVAGDIPPPSSLCFITGTIGRVGGKTRGSRGEASWGWGLWEVVWRRRWWWGLSEVR